MKENALYIYADDGSIYKINESDWRTEGSVLQEKRPTHAVVTQLVESGALVAVMPATLNVGEICTLVSLKNLSK